MKRAHDGHLRTMLQSLDTARFRDDCPADRMTDVAQARSEILSAMLFGYEIVVPAGAIADCPALIELIPEVFDNAERHMEEVGRQRGSPYRLFRIGLEEKYLWWKGRTGYSAFISEYLESKLDAVPGLVALTKLAEQNAWDPAFLTAVLGRAYVDRDWSAIDRLGERVSKATGNSDHEAALIRYRHYAQLVHKYLESSPDSPLAARELFSDRSFISSIPGTYYLQTLSDLVNRSCELVDDHRQLQREQRVLEWVFEDLVRNNLNTAERGSWYRYEGVFRDEGMWEYVRNWLDIALYSNLHAGFDVVVPSYFTQELDADSIAVTKTLSAMSDQSVVEFCSRSRRSGSPGVQYPERFEIDWSAIWELIADQDYQDSVSGMQAKFREALANQRQRLRIIEARQTSPEEALIEDIVRQRREAMVAAFDQHIGFLNGRFKNFKLLSRDGKIVVTRKRHVPPRRIVKTVIGMLSGAGDVGSPVIDSIVDKVAEKLTGKAIDAAWRKDHWAPSEIDAVARPSNIDVKDRESFIDAERVRLNFWITI